MAHRSPFKSARLALVVALTLNSIVGDVRGQLPFPRIDHVFPPGGQTGSDVSVSLGGEQLAELSQFLSPHPGIGGVFEEGQLKLSVAADVPAGLYDLRVAGRLGVSNAMAFHVAPFPEVLVTQPRASEETAFPLEFGRIANAQVTPEQVDWYVFSAKAGQEVHLEVIAERLDSRMDATLVLTDAEKTVRLENRDAEGRDAVLHFQAPKDGKYFVQVYDFTYTGAQYPYRLALLEGGPNELALKAAYQQPADLAVAEIECASTGGPLDFWGTGEEAASRVVEMDLLKGDERVVEIFSDRLGEASDFRLSVDRIISENEPLQRIGEADDVAENPGGRRFPMDHRDPIVRFTAPGDGRYRVGMEDQFSSAGRYYFQAREPRPGFHLVAGIETLTDENNALSISASNIRKGGTAALTVFVERRDGFNEMIDIQIEGLPKGVISAGAKVLPGQNQARVLLTAEKEAMPWAGEIRLVATGESGGRCEARGVKLLWAVNDFNLERSESRLTSGLALAVVGEPEPIVLRPKEAVYEVPLGGRLEIPFVVERSVEQVGTFTVTPTGFSGLAQPPQLPLEAAMAEMTLALDLKNEGDNAFAVGEFIFYLRANGAQVRYRAKPEADPADLRHVFLSAPVRVRILPQP